MQNNTVVYLIRHSSRFDELGYIDEYKTVQGKTLRREKIILSVDGEKKSEVLSNEKELQNLDIVYVSNCVRTLETAKYIIEKQHLRVNIDERFDERVPGKSNEDIYPNWYELQYSDINFKTEGGESQKEVRERFDAAFDEVVAKNKGKRIAIFSHGRAMSFFLLRWCKMEKVVTQQHLRMSFNGKIFFDKAFDAPEVIKIILDENNNPINIELIEFEDLKQK